MGINQAHQVLEQCLSREPSLIFDVLSQLSNAPSTGLPIQGQPSWCICQRCREMPTLLERKYCNQQPAMCIAELPHMEAYTLDKGRLCLAQRIWNDLHAVVDLPDEGEDNRQFRHAAYRQFVAWRCGTLGTGHSVVIPSCCMWTIHDPLMTSLTHMASMVNLGSYPGRNITFFQRVPIFAVRLHQQ